MKKQLDERSKAKLKRRLLKFLSKGSAQVLQTSDGQNVLVERADAQRLRLPVLVLREALSDGLVTQKIANHSASTMDVELSVEGFTQVEKARHEGARSNSSGGSTSQHVAAEQMVRNDGSPLARLYFSKRKMPGGWLSKEEYHAGERLRIDFEKSQVSQGLGINWDAFGMPRAASHSSDGACVGDFADAAHKRLSKALSNVGPEMADLLLDVCCFLKGLETVEAERGWPRRSAKLLLKVALATLDRYYHPKPANSFRRVRTWHEGEKSISV